MRSRQHGFQGSVSSATADPGLQLFQSYTNEEDRDRTNLHYEQPPEFFHPILGGEWHTYSCNLWSGARTDTESQEAKLDLLARLMCLEPGKRVLEIGCGWGGPLVYLSKTYGVQGVGLTLSPTQKRYADERINQHGVSVEVVEAHWQQFDDSEGFDVVFTDEVIVHFKDFVGFCGKARSWLRPGGIFLNKELHLTNSRYKQLARADAFVHEIFGLTGNYRTLGEELIALDENGFAQQVMRQLSLENYERTVGQWEKNMLNNREQLHAIAGPEYYRQFRTYLRIVRKLFRRRTMTLDIVVSHKL